MSETNNVTVVPSLATWAWPVLEQFISPELSQLNVSGAPELKEPPNYFGSFILNAIFKVRYADEWRCLGLVFLRRYQHAVREYAMGREVLQEYIEKLKISNNHTGTYLKAVTHFEQAIASICISLLSLRQVIKCASPHEKNIIFTDGRFAKIPPGNVTKYDRLKEIYNRSKHFDEDIAEAKTPSEMLPSPVWVTNLGIKCSTAEVSFQELIEIFNEVSSSAKWLSEEAPAEAEKRKAAEANTAAPSQEAP
jgi:hypothetical protein